MKISTVALALALGILWGASMAGVAAISAALPGYGTKFFELMGSLYPGVEGSNGIVRVVICALYGLVDGCFFGFLIGWIYNFIAARLARQRDSPGS